MRVAALVLLLTLPAWSGCFGNDGPDYPLAQPTDAPIVVPTRATPRAPVVFNTSDPGYRVENAWRIGDGWDYESDRSNILRVRVVDQRLVDDGTRFFLVETTRVASGGQVERVAQAWVDPRTWSIVNETDERGATDSYRPGVPLRFWRNATTSYEHARHDASGALVLTQNVTIASRLFPVHQTLLFPWGYVEARRVEHNVTIRGGDGARSNETIVRWVHRDYLNEVQFQLGSGETYKLVAARAGDFRRGQLA
ncbi:MAG TPA: hypothetical protein VM582_10435 [Candidatus Thermoplasmatota archaeon]|nr:hypothetical protein [Candidatus Thermoplasmatota archaeon]